MLRTLAWTLGLEFADATPEWIACCAWSLERGLGATWSSNLKTDRDACQSLAGSKDGSAEDHESVSGAVASCESGRPSPS